MLVQTVLFDGFARWTSSLRTECSAPAACQASARSGVPAAPVTILMIVRPGSTTGA